MALTVSITELLSLGNMVASVGTIAFDSSYPTGGETLAAATIGLQSIKFVIFEPTGGIVFEYDHTNAKVKAYGQGVTVGAAGSATIDDFAVSAGPGAATSSVLGLGSTLGSSTLSLGALTECPSTNDLSTITGVNYFAIGY